MMLHKLSGIIRFLQKFIDILRLASSFLVFQETLSKENKVTALKKIPSLLEVMGHTYFFGGFLVGPQFPMQRFQAFVKGAFSDPVTGGLPDR